MAFRIYSFIACVFIFIWACEKIQETPQTNSKKVALGKQLFFDPRLSETNEISCASCHQPQFSFSDNTSFSQGILGRKGGRNAPAIINPIKQSRFFHDGRAKSLEEQAKGPMNNPLEMGQIAFVVPKLKHDSVYVAAFKDVFNDTISITHIAEAIAEFERTLLFYDSKYDAYTDGNLNALSDDQKKGMELFFGKAKCTDCHSGTNFSDNQFHNIGFFTDRNVSDKGRFEVTKNELDLGKFKTPSLRNIALTAPYFHDGRTSTLIDVIRLYNKPNPMGTGENKDTLIQPIHLTREEEFQLVQFLHSLTSQHVLETFVDGKTIDSVAFSQNYTRHQFEHDVFLPEFDERIHYFQTNFPQFLEEAEITSLYKLSDSMNIEQKKIHIVKTYFRGKFKHLFENGDHILFNQQYHYSSRE